MQSIDKQTIKYNLFLTSYLKKQNKKTKGNSSKGGGGVE